MNKTYGSILLLLGIILLIFTFYIGYTLYLNVHALSMAPPSIQTVSNLNASELPSAIANNLINSIPTSNLFYYVISVMLLFLFANIGYKFALLGIKVLQEHSVKIGKNKVNSNGDYK